MLLLAKLHLVGVDVSSLFADIYVQEFNIASPYGNVGVHVPSPHVFFSSCLPLPLPL